MPTLNDLTECLLNAGVIQYSNLSDFRKRMNVYRNLRKKIRFSLDTNLLYHGFFNIIDAVSPDETLIVETVRDEIETQLNHKYTGVDIDELKRGAQYQRGLYDELFHRRKKRSRKAAFLAMESYRSVRDDISHCKGIEESRRSSQENDAIIVKSLKEYEKENYGLPILLTADDAIIDICELHGLEYFLLKYSREFILSRCTFKQLNKLVRNLAGVLGFIKVNSVIIFGEYKGKRAPDEFKIRFLNTKIRKTMSKHLQICRQLFDLDISI